MKTLNTRRRSPITLGTKLVTSETLSAREFLDLVNKNPSAIKSSRAIMPSPGKRGFGSIQVHYATPKYEPA